MFNMIEDSLRLRPGIVVRLGDLKNSGSFNNLDSSSVAPLNDDEDSFHEGSETRSGVMKNKKVRNGEDNETGRFRSVMVTSFHPLRHRGPTDPAVGPTRLQEIS